MTNEKDWTGGGNQAVYTTIGASNHSAEEREEADYYATSQRGIIKISGGGVVNSFIIREKLPSLNEVLSKYGANKYAGSAYKKRVQNKISGYIETAKASGELKPTKGQAFLFFEWHERTKKRDADNIASAKKFILDALVNENILPDDSRKYVKGFRDTIVDDSADYVVVDIIE